MSRDMVQLPGTVRTRAPEDTWAAISPHRKRFGITRMARLTHLDYIGLPVHAAIRPAAHTSTASLGRGATPLMADISAVMVAIELWHCEQPIAPVLRASAYDAAPPYPLSALPLKVPEAARALEQVPVEWTVGTGLRTGQAVPVPTGLVHRPASRPPWQPDLFRATTTGLACGDTRDEAVLHALYEVIERDTLHADDRAAGRRRTFIDPATVDDPYCRTVLDRLREANLLLELAIVDNPYRVPTCLAYVWSEDYPVWFAGAGTHTDPHIALTRAATEATQNRLTRIAGVRDDLPSHEKAFEDTLLRPQTAEGLNPWGARIAHHQPWRGSFADQVTQVADRIERVTRHEPVCLDLSGPADPVAAVKVICPATRDRTQRSLTR
ncbi:YcaO-like family protein [Streptomyces mordarskii]|uniref:YcaO-like family protein n=2 Tax=Streptomyces mordarskii TaxID=1226758 RepID=A0ABP3PYC2_9ACTN